MTLWFINEFHIQILALELLLCRRLPRRPHFWLKLIPLAALYVAIPGLIPQGFLSPALRIGSWFTVSFLLMILLSALLLYCVYDISIKQLVFCCCVAHTLQHMVHCLSRVIWYLFKPGPAASQFIELLLMAGVVILLYRFLKMNPEIGVESADIKSPQLILFAVISTLTVYFISFWSNWNEGDIVGAQFFDFLSCVLLLVILLDLFRFRRAEEEQLVLTRLLRHEQEQHEMNRATVEVINRKCHDLKHQISALRGMSGADREKSISELENAILLYDNLAQTGNSDLDIVLAEKTLLAEKRGVKLQCIADGQRLNFMRAEDICSLFGNALDNAIEAAAQAEPPETRIVALNVSARGNVLTVHVENPCLTAPDFSGGLPLTTKVDTDYHGFGMRSMRYVAEKYGGVLTTRWEDGVFLLDALFILE